MRTVLENLKNIYEIEDLLMANLEKEKRRGTYLIEFVDANGVVLLRGFTCAFNRAQAQERAPLAVVTRISDIPAHRDGQVYYEV